MDNNRKVYMAIGESRKLEIKVILDDEAFYEGNIEDAPEEVKRLKYSKIKAGTMITYWAYSELQ